jgi:thiamine biosynthesis protein ThiS
LQVQVNGERRDVPDSGTLGGLVRDLALAPERLAIELNQRVVRRADWHDTVLQEGDRVEIVHFVGGGSKRVSSFRFQVSD